LREHIIQAANSAVQSPKAAGVIIATAGSSGTLTILDMLPVVFGVMLNLIAMVSALIFSYINVKQHKIKMQIKMQIMEKKLAEKKVSE